MIVSVMYQIGAGNRFDLDYYLKTHMPLVDARWAQYGLKSARVLRGIGSPSGDPARHHIIALLDFDTLDAFKAAAAAHGAEVLGDVPNFTDVQPDIQFSEVVA
jgi:uncharacterized protein (TIGR02118 family)